MLIHLHKQATTTPKVRAAIQASDDAGTVLAERFGVSAAACWSLADNLANGYNPAELFPVYHLVLPEGMTAPVPHTPSRVAAMAEAA